MAFYSHCSCCTKLIISNDIPVKLDYESLCCFVNLFNAVVQHSYRSAGVVQSVQCKDGPAITCVKLPDGFLRGLPRPAGAHSQHDRWQRQHCFTLQRLPFQLHRGGPTAWHRLIEFSFLGHIRISR